MASSRRASGGVGGLWGPLGTSGGLWGFLVGMDTHIYIYIFIYNRTDSIMIKRYIEYVVYVS